MRLPLPRALAPLVLAALVALGALTAACTASKPTPAPTTEVVVRTSTPTPAATAPARTPEPTATPTPTPRAAVVPPKAPETGRWIDVDVTRFIVRLMDGKQVTKEIGPVAVGREVDTGAYESTQTGLFHVYNKTAPRTFDAPYNTYIEWWVGFDPQKDNGFHSFLLDKEGKVVDAATGRISNGCIRTGAAEDVFKFAEVNMPVWVHA